MKLFAVASTLLLSLSSYADRWTMLECLDKSNSPRKLYSISNSDAKSVGFELELDYGDLKVFTLGSTSMKGFSVKENDKKLILKRVSFRFSVLPGDGEASIGIYRYISKFEWNKEKGTSILKVKEGGLWAEKTLIFEKYSDCVDLR